MRCVVTAFAIVAFFVAPSYAGLPSAMEFSSLDSISKWMANYRTKPNPARLPAAVRAMAQFGLFKEPESAGVYVGFIAGVLGANPDRAEELVGKMLPMPAADEWVFVRAIAYSNHPEWQNWLRKFAERLPSRKVMIEKYLAGKLPTLYEIPLERNNPNFWDRARGYFVKDAHANAASDISFDRSPELLDTLWGYYFATGFTQPVDRIISFLPWAKERDSVDKLTMGSMAKYTLASNAARDAELLAHLKNASKSAPKQTASVLNEAIEAAETMETTRLRKDALAAIEELKRKGPGYKRDVSTWGQIGQGALALGCIVAATTGHVELGLPCIITGAASSATLNYWNTN
jgi:hypothetical protein